MGDSLRDLSEHIRAAREHRSLSQDQLAQEIGNPTTRTAIAHLEQSRRLPPAEVLEQLCTYLQIPAPFWRPLLDPSIVTRTKFEDALSELVGRRVSLRNHDEQSAAVAHKVIVELFNSGQTTEQLHKAFCAGLIYYDVRAPSLAFFARFLQPEAFISVSAFTNKVQAYQAIAIRLYSSFGAAYEHLSVAPDLEAVLSQLQTRSDATHRARTAWTSIEDIPAERLADLGYISAARVKNEQKERALLSEFLTELAGRLHQHGRAALEEYSPKKRRKMGSLLRKFNSSLQHDLMSPLFAPDADRVRREAGHLAPKADDDIARMKKTQATGLRNLARYLAADYMDVYVATSMRTDADFASVNTFVAKLFAHPAVHPLKLRYFNPTQSWVEDRVAKGLVEALMLKRADITIYLAQKTDSFGKDSEASVALGQGKPVIVYVPSLRVDGADVDSEQLGLLPRASLKQYVEAEATGEDREVDDTTDHQALLTQLLSLRLQRLSPESLAAAARGHWADFDLYGEDSRIEHEEERAAYRAWLDKAVGGEAPALDARIRDHVIGALVATASNFEKRATVFREVHPLALQVILSSGVLNGILVARSIESCALILSQLIKNELDLELRVDDFNYRLVERSTGSTIRVIARHALIESAFDAFYEAEKRSS